MVPAPATSASATAAPAIFAPVTTGPATAMPTASDPHVAAGRGAAFRRYLTQLAAILALVVALGIPATLRLAGEGGSTAMAVGCLASLAASLAGSLPIYRGFGRPMPAAMPTVMGAIAIRLGVVLFVGLAVALSGLVAPAPFLVWLAVAHAALLVADTPFALASTRAGGDGRGGKVR